MQQIDALSDFSLLKILPVLSDVLVLQLLSNLSLVNVPKWVNIVVVHCVSKKTGPLLRFEITPTNCA